MLKGKTQNIYVLSFRLLKVLAARKDPRGLSGDILINGAPRPANFKCNSGYVPQVSINGFVIELSSVSVWTCASVYMLVCSSSLNVMFIDSTLSIPTLHNPSVFSIP